MSLIPRAAGTEDKHGYKELVEELRRVQELKNGLIRDYVIEEHRIDILAAWVLGLELKWYHLAILEHQERDDLGLTLAWRGCGKTTAGTVLRAIFELLVNPDIRILIASKSHGNAIGMLEEVKGYMKTERFIEIFGDLSGSDKWDTFAINVANKKIVSKEHTIDTTGVETALPSRHWDLMLIDDVCDEATSRTKAQREKLKTWYFKTLDPCLMPNGRKYVNGTRYHHEDLMHILESGEMEGRVLTIPIENEKGEPADAERFPREWIDKKRRDSGPVIFDSQYMLNVDKIAGSPFEWEGLSNYYTIRKDDEGERIIVRHYEGEAKEIPYSKLLIVQAVDPSTGTVGAGGAYFAHVTIGIDADQFKYILDYFYQRIPFHSQLTMIRELYRQHGAAVVGIESNAYQKVLVDQLRYEEGDKIPVVPVFTRADKQTRILKRTATFDTNQVWLKRSQSVLQDHLMSVLDKDNKKDLFDALDIGITLAESSFRKVTKRKKRDEPGLFSRRRRDGSKTKKRKRRA